MLPLFVRVLRTVDPDCAVVLSPLTLALFAAIQENVEGIFAVNGMETEFPLQMLTPLKALMIGAGFTVTVMVCTVPAQPEVLVGVME